ncbi:MAG TPA: hypothetical protein VH189_11820, partial [Rhizomicrobium sp.]|nr:hypothetical protein [Rhizomicrobium sp.]
EGQPMRVELDYALAIHRPQGTYELPAVGGEIAIPDVARCATSIGPFGTNVILRCMQAGQEHMRVSFALMDRPKGPSIPGRARYSPSDAPYRNGDAMITRFGGGITFRNAFASRPLVDAAPLSKARMRLTVSEPLQHVFRRVTIGNLRLGAWVAREADVQ